MRAKRILRALRAMRPGALTLTMVVAAVVLGSVSAGALAPRPAREACSEAQRPTPESRTSRSRRSGRAAGRAAASSRPPRAARSWFTACSSPAAAARGQAGGARRTSLAHARRRPHPPQRALPHPLPRAAALARPPVRVAFDGSRRARSVTAAAGRSSRSRRPSRRGTTTQATPPADSTPPTASPTRRCPAAPR